MKLENKDGAVMTYSQVCSISADPDPVTAALVNLYPMPVTDKHFTIDVQGLAMAPTACRIFDLNGRPVATMKLVGARTFSTEIGLPRSLVPGVYLLQLTDGKGKKLITRSFLVKIGWHHPARLAPRPSQFRSRYFVFFRRGRQKGRYRIRV